MSNQPSINRVENASREAAPKQVANAAIELVEEELKRVK
jgi:hypothetical protein